MRSTLRSSVAALLLAVPVASTWVVLPAAALSPATAPRIDHLEVNADGGLAPGSTLDFTVRATPRGEVRVQVQGTSVALALRERERGVYRGSYTVRRSDRIAPTNLIRASLAVGSRNAVDDFRFPPAFMALARQPAPRPQQQAQAQQQTPPQARAQARIDSAPTVAADSSRDVAAVSPAVPAAGAEAATAPPGPTGRDTEAAAGSSLSLQLVNPRNRGAAADSDVVIEGRTRPGANVQVQVDAIAPGAGDRTSVAQSLSRHSVVADPSGNFSVNLGSYRGVMGTRFEVLVVARHGELSAERRVVLAPRPG